MATEDHACFREAIAPIYDEAVAGRTHQASPSKSYRVQRTTPGSVPGVENGSVWLPPVDKSRPGLASTKPVLRVCHNSKGAALSCRVLGRAIILRRGLF